MTPTLGAPERILVVDDDAQLCTLLTLRLRGDGYEVVVAGDGQEAIDMLEGGLEVDAVITDHRMPRADGVTLSRHIRAGAGWEHIPIILLTGAEHSVEVVEAVAGLGGVYYMRKGCDMERLGRTLRMALGHGRSQQAARQAV